MKDENYLAKKAIFETLKSKGVVSGEYDDFVKSRMSPAETAQLENDQKEMARKVEHLNWKRSLQPEDLEKFSQVFETGLDNQIGK